MSCLHWPNLRATYVRIRLIFEKLRGWFVELRTTKDAAQKSSLNSNFKGCNFKDCKNLSIDFPRYNSLCSNKALRELLRPSAH